MEVTLSAKNLNKQVNYTKPSKTFKVDNNYLNEDNTHFLVKSLQKEVNHLNKKEKKKAFKILQKTQISTLSMLSLAPMNTVMAATEVSKSAEILMPTDVIEVFKFLIAIAVAIMLGMAMLMGLWTGVYGMFNKKKATEARKQRSEIIKSVVEGLSIIPIVALVWFLFQFFFGSLDWFTTI